MARNTLGGLKKKKKHINSRGFYYYFIYSAQYVYKHIFKSQFLVSYLIIWVSANFYSRIAD